MRLPRNINAAELNNSPLSPSAHQTSTRLQQQATRLDTRDQTSNAGVINKIKQDAVASAMEQNTAANQANNLKHMYAYGIQQRAGIDGYKAKIALAEHLKTAPQSLEFLGL